MTNYQEQDEALDEELRAMLAQESDDEVGEPEPSPEEPAGTEEATQEIEEAEEADATDIVVDQPEQSEEMVPESRYKNAVVAMNKAQQELADKRKQDDQRDREIQQLTNQVQALTNQLKAKQAEPPADTPTPQNVDDDELEQAKELFPEAVNPLLKMINELQNKLNLIEKESGDFRTVTERIKQNEQQTAEEKHWNTILASHPDAAEIAESSDFAEWRSAQPPLVQNALSNGSAQDVVFALNLYRAGKQPVHDDKPIKPDKLAAARQAATPSVKQSGKPNDKTPVFTHAQIAKMSMEEFGKNEEAIDQAMARGEVM